MFVEFFACLFISDLLYLELEACTKANEELQKLREVAEPREAATEEKLRLEREARRGTTRRSYAMFFLSCSSAWADPAGCFLQKRRIKWHRAGRHWIA
jgi:hypothetical protein